MKKIQKIAKLELSLLFFSPSAWIVLVVFFIQMGIVFTELLYKYETNQQLGRPLQVLTKILFAGEYGILAVAQKYLSLYIPLITMGLMTRETQSGSIKLLYSSPVKISEIIFGKFLSVAVYNLLLALILTGFIGVAHFTISNVDVPFVLGGILGIYLLMCAYAAIGLFLSCITSYAVVAVVSTFAVLAFLNFVGEIGQAYDFVREITYWLSLRNRADAFVNGLIVSQNVLYFVLVIFLFLTLSIWWLVHQRKKYATGKKVLKYVLLMVSVLFVGYISTQPQFNFYIDTTRFQDRTLTPNSQKLLQQLDKPIKMTTYVNVIHSSAAYGAPENRIKDLKRFEAFRRFLPDLEMDYVYYYDSIQYMDTTKTIQQLLHKAARVHKIDLSAIKSPEEIRKEVDLKSENNRLVRYIHYGSKTLPLRMFDDIYLYPNEKDISSTLKKFLEKPGKVAVMNAHGERSINKRGDDSYRFLLKGLNIRGSLINSGFDVVAIDVDTVPQIPADLDVLIVADPKRAYEKEVLSKIKNYIAQGGNLIIAAETSSRACLNNITQQFGVEFKEGVILQESEDFSPDLVQVQFLESAVKTPFKFYKEAKMIHPKAMAIACQEKKDYTITPITTTSKNNSWIETKPFDLNTETVRFDSVKQQRVVVPTVVAVTRKLAQKTQKIIVVGDADFMSNAQIVRNRPRSVNVLFSKKMFRWMTDDRFPVTTSRPKPIDKEILVSRSEINLLKWVLLGVIPLLFTALQGSLLIKRFRK